MLSPHDTVDTPAFTFTPANPLIDLNEFRIGADNLSGIGSFDGWAGYIDGARFYGSYLDNSQLQEVLASYVPEPSSAVLLVIGALGLMLRRRNRDSVFHASCVPGLCLARSSRAGSTPGPA